MTVSSLLLETKVSMSFVIIISHLRSEQINQVGL